MTTTDWTASEAVLIQRAVARARREVRGDVAAGHLPPHGIRSFSDLHDFVDANEYGGLTGDFLDHFGYHADEGGLPDRAVDAANEVQERVHRWLGRGLADSLCSCGHAVHYVWFAKRPSQRAGWACQSCPCHREEV